MRGEGAGEIGFEGVENYEALARFPAVQLKGVQEGLGKNIGVVMVEPAEGWSTRRAAGRNGGEKILFYQHMV